MLNSFQSLGTCTIHCYQSGVLGAVPDFDKVDDVIAYIDTFAEAIKASDSPRTFTVTAQKYSSIAGIDAGAAFEAVTAPAAAAVADLAQVVVDYNDLLADIDVLQGTAVDDPAQLAELQRRISTDLGTIQTDYTSCRGSLAYPTVQSLIARNEITAPTAYHAAIDPLLSRTPVQLQDHIYLRYQNDQYVGPHASGGAEYYPTMVDAGSRVRLAVLGPVSYRRVVRAGDAIRITSSESGLDGYDTLGAWLRSDCYYYTSGSPTVDEQRWTLLPVDATAQVVSYGDHVKIVNVAWNERLSRDGSYLTTTSDDDVYWIIEPASTA
jgi:hypothetical protein